MLTSRKTAAAVAAGAALVAGGTVAAINASASTAHHTLRLTAVSLQSRQIGNSFVQSEKDLQKGKVTGYDTVTCRFSRTSPKANCDAAVARSNGLIYIHARVAQSGNGSGTVTGGTHAYQGARGTVTLAPGNGQRQTKITINFTR